MKKSKELKQMFAYLIGRIETIYDLVERSNDIIKASQEADRIIYESVGLRLDALESKPKRTMKKKVDARDEGESE